MMTIPLVSQEIGKKPVAQYFEARTVESSRPFDRSSSTLEERLVSRFRKVEP